MDTVATIRLLYAEGCSLPEIIAATMQDWCYIQSCIVNCPMPARRLW